MGLAEREGKRKSIVGSLIDGKSDEQAATINETQESASEPTLDVFNIKPKQKDETRSKRVNFLIKPSIYNKAQKKCKRLDISLNECINQFLERWAND